MPRNSLKKLKDKFPYFMDKSDDSNFSKTKEVFNNRLVDVYNELFQVYLAGKLEKNLLIWKEQTSAKEYVINFVANYPYLESVTCYKNDEVIYTETFSFTDEVHTFNYSYKSTSDNIIPNDKFKIYVTTHEEYSLVKGFPENDIIVDNEYDHDTSLDSFGAFYRIPRKNYKILTDEDLVEMNETRIIDYYKKTEPPFNDKASEDDYHYMNRILTYISYYNKIPLPVLEVWKIYGLDPENPDLIKMINREKYLCKMFEMNRHLNSDGEYDESWIPERWEHKDSLICPVTPEIFFFAQVDNASPIEGQKVNFTFNFYNALAKKASNKYIIVPYVDDKIFENNFSLTSNSWSVPTDDFPGIDEGKFTFDFTFRAYESLKKFHENSQDYLESDEIRIIIKGCETADLYVDCVDGDDSNNGSQDYPLRTLEYALTKIEGSNNVIALLNKNERFNIEKPLKITETCSILSCPKGAVIYQNNGWDIFKIMQDTRLYLKNIMLKHKCCELYASGNDFSNENVVNYPVNITIPKWVCKIATKINMINELKIYAHRDTSFTGMLLTDSGDYSVGNEIEVDNVINTNCPETTYDLEKPVSNETIELYHKNNIIDSVVTNNEGEYNLNYNFNEIGDFNLKVKHPESKKYCYSEGSYNVTVEPMPTQLSVDVIEKILVDDSFTVNYLVSDYYGDNIIDGTLKLYENNKVVKTIKNGKDLVYTPTVEGLHNYKLVYSHDETYVDSQITFTVNVVKYNTSIILLGNGKSSYLSSENITLNGVISDENSNILSNANLKLYDGTNLITTLISDANGEISWSNKLTVGTHNLHLEYEGTRKYNSSTSNSYRVRVRENELADITLKLYPENKVLLADSSNIPVHVFACDKNENPLKTSFKIWNSYDNACELNNSAIYTTGNDGWCTINLSTQAIINCGGIYLQAISTIDEDICSNVSHVVYGVKQEIELSGGIFSDESYYSYSDDVLHLNGYLVDSDDDPVPNESIKVNMIVDNATIETKTLKTDILGEWNTIFTTNKNIRGKDIKFQINHVKSQYKYSSFTDDVTVQFKQLTTKIVTTTEDITLPTAEPINISGEILDENNRKVDTGTLNILFNNKTYSKDISNGIFELQINDVLKADTYPLQFNFVENTFYKASNKSKNILITKVTPILSVESEHSIPVLESTLIGFGISRNNRIPLTGQVLLINNADDSEISSADVNSNELNVLLEETGEFDCTLVYNGNEYLEKVSENILLIIYGPYYIISCNKEDNFDIILTDEFSENIDDLTEEYLVLTELNDNYPKLIITSDIDYDTSDLGPEDVVIVDSDEMEPDILLIDEGDDT